VTLITILTAAEASATLPDVSLIFNQQLTVNGGSYTRLILPQSGLNGGYVYALTIRPDGAADYGDPYIWGIVYHTGSNIRRVRRESRFPGYIIEQSTMDKSLQDQGEDNAEFRIYCEPHISSCTVRATIHLRAPGANAANVFYTEGREPGVSDNRISTNKDFYYPTGHTGKYSLNVPYTAGQYIYLFRDTGVSGSAYKALTFWVRSSGSIKESDLWIALTDADHYTLNSWQPLSNYVAINQSHTWYEVRIPLIDLGVANRTFHGVAIRSFRSGTALFDEIQLSSETPQFKIRLPLADHTPYTVPITAVMDNSRDVVGLITAYDGAQARYEYGCLSYTREGTSTCGPLPSPITTEVFGYKGAASQSFVPNLNYNDGISAGNQYLWYDEHTGYDFGLPEGTAVLAAAGGTVRHVNDSLNTVIIDHGDGYETFYLHMRRDTTLIPDGALVGEGQRIGSIGGTGGVEPHLHLTVKRNGLRIDPYRLNLWR
jgi:hypothetical protein